MNICSYIMTLTPLLKLISDPSRLAILLNLRTQVLCVNDLVSATRLSQSLVSHHLKDLRDGKLVTGEKFGRQVSYSLTSKGQQVMQILQNL